jgi:hypothetical protein
VFCIVVVLVGAVGCNSVSGFSNAMDMPVSPAEDLGRCLPSSWGSARHQDRDSVFAERHDDLRSRESISGATLAIDRGPRSAERHDSVWPDHSISFHSTSENVVAYIAV